ncbi:MAG: ABC transporter permease subunit [Acholeplasmataceae bacterium]
MKHRLKHLSKHLKTEWQLYVLLIPMLIWFVLWVYKPMGGLLIAFKQYEPIKGVMGSSFVGLYNFKQLMFSSAFGAQFWTAFRNTLLINMYGLVFGFPVPIILALFFSEISKESFRKFSQTVLYLPHFLSEVTITGIVLTLLYHGVDQTGMLASMIYKINIFGHQLVQPGTKILETARYFRPMYIITGLWKESGYNSIVYFAAIMGVSPVLYEALKVDGGNKWQEIRFVTLPGMAPTLIIMLVLRIGRMLSVGYERVLLLYNTNVYSTADVLSTFVYRIGLEGTNKSLAGAADMFNAIIGFILVIGANFISRRVSDTSLW